MTDYRPGLYGFCCAALCGGILRLIDIFAGPPSYMPTWVYAAFVIGGSFGMITIGRKIFVK